MSNEPALEISEIDVHDDAALTEWYDVSAAALNEGMGEHSTVWGLAELRVSVREPSRVLERHLYVGRVGGVAVAVGAHVMPLLDNLEAATIVCEVAPEHRRRGYGSEMLAFVEQRAPELGRPLLDNLVSWPDSHGADGSGWPGCEFATARGYRLTLGDVQRELSLPVDDRLLDDLATEAASHHDGYRLTSWVGAVPEQLALGWETLASSLVTEAPTGDREIEPEVADVANLREREAVAAKQGRTIVCTAALTGDGEVAAYTDLAVTPHEPGKAYQWGTLVRTADRGHRLGLAVKVANLRLLQSLDLGVERLITWNAEVNSHMVGVNVRLGFRAVARAGEFQKRLDSSAP
ncbi:GNAT family N-acetyltransferase [Nocardioides sp.]|uniref:GNAT family N-acetyltransferase n=1 Tax=Nocardioides sp. TaxID=35761 RepID=UPI002B266855|nr:GNAT family N-acetyltransferase [Nocardioides sp.]